jgi:Fe2+ or Zn2+ uptake regulation protein
LDKERLDNDRLGDALATLKKKGGRITPTRRAVIQILISESTHLSAEDLAKRIQHRLPDVHISTIYITLDALEAVGVVDHVHLGHGRALYHLSSDIHQHLVCEVCSSVTEVPEPFFATLKGELQETFGFTMRAHHFAVIGRCRNCAGTERPKISQSIMASPDTK